MARTRATKGAASTKKAEAEKPTSASAYTLPPEAESPPRFFIIPKTATPAARIVTLQNPRYAKPTRYLVCPEAGFFEFNKITPPKSAPRSWLLDNARLEDGSKKDGFDAQVASKPELYVATPIDPLFLLLPALASTEECKSGDDAKGPKKRMFLSSDDHFDAISEPGGHLADILAWPSAREILVSRMDAVCDSVEAGDEQMYRLSEKRLVEEILSKAKRMSENGLPKSLEDKFVTKALEAPILGIKSKPPPALESKSTSESSTPQPDGADSQSTVSSVETSASSLSEASTAATSVSGDSGANEVLTSAITASQEVVKLQRLRIAFNFICSSYIGPALAGQLKELAAKSSSVDFTSLDEYITQLTKLRQEAMAARAPDYSRKRAMDDDEEYERTEKRRKKEEEDKVKKANQSRGVKQLAKVNTSGMKKMSDFFKKKT
ncbi:ribonuclease H2, subunit B [Podospora aff. communis PSN243]|uniref:Ribonuclease H2 subunit B n=1 Tax=Podospora aff. communis PSN243 TaxID=3040156 RepID=A0AAV9H0F6_9PEZI|nr:ribonuclease H2, subunit B [Podospora aff. communis PSN243]